MLQRFDQKAGVPDAKLFGTSCAIKMCPLANLFARKYPRGLPIAPPNNLSLPATVEPPANQS
jgi:hypothetical protein